MSPSRRVALIRSRCGGGLVTALALTALAVGGGSARPATADAAAWRATLPGSVILESSTADSGVAVDDGRVWFASVRYEPSAPYRAIGVEVEARPLDGGAGRRTSLDFAAVTRPTGEFAAFDSAQVRTFRVRDGRVYLLGTWWMEDTSGDPTKGDVPSGLSFLAVFDSTTGAILRQDHFPASESSATGAAVRLLYGTPAVLTTSADPRLEYPSLDPWTSTPLPFPAAADTRVVGRFALVPSPQSGGSVASWGDGSGTLRVVEIATGRILYRLTARRLTRAAGAPRNARPDVTLMTDGSLGVAIPSGGRVVRPVAVDAAGNIVLVGRPVRRTTSVAAWLQGARAFVGWEATVTSNGRNREMRRLWLVDRNGRRGHRISTAAEDGLQRDSLVPFWADGERALWSTTSNSRGQRVGLTAVTATGRMALKRGGAPTAPPEG